MLNEQLEPPQEETTFALFSEMYKRPKSELTTLRLLLPFFSFSLNVITIKNHCQQMQTECLFNHVTKELLQNAVRLAH